MLLLCTLSIDIPMNIFFSCDKLEINSRHICKESLIEHLNIKIFFPYETLASSGSFYKSQYIFQPEVLISCILICSSFTIYFDLDLRTLRGWNPRFFRKQSLRSFLIYLVLRVMIDLWPRRATKQSSTAF